MEIKPTYVTFEHAKLLKEKGFNVPSEKIWYLPHPDKAKANGIEEHCWQVIPKSSNLISGVDAIEQHVVVEWLRIKYGIWIEVIFSEYHAVKGTRTAENEDIEIYGYYFIIKNVKEFDIHIWGDEKNINNWFESPQEAYNNAFNHVLNKLI